MTNPSKMASRPARRADKCDGTVARFVIGVDGAADEALRVRAISRRVSVFCTGGRVSHIFRHSQRNSGLTSTEYTRLGEVRFFVVASGGLPRRVSTVGTQDNIKKQDEQELHCRRRCDLE